MEEWWHSLTEWHLVGNQQNDKTEDWYGVPKEEVEQTCLDTKARSIS